jgi:hypothetical protein
MTTKHYRPDMKALAERSGAIIPPFQRRLDEKYNKALAELRRIEAKTRNSATKVSAMELSVAEKVLENAKNERKHCKQLISDALNLFEKIDEFRSTTDPSERELLKDWEESFHFIIDRMEWRMKEADMMSGRLR